MRRSRATCIPILAGNDFQEGLKNYRDLAFLGSTLARWDENMIVYNDMIEAREKAYAERIPKVDALLASDAVGTMAARREAIEGRFNDIVSSEDVAALGTPEQRDQWRRIERIEAAIAADPGNAELAGAAGEAAPDQGRAVLGSAQFLSRPAVCRATRTQGPGQVAGRSQQPLAARAAGAPDRAHHHRRLSQRASPCCRQRMTTLRANLAKESAAQSDLLGQIAVDELQAQQQRITDYEVQARFALATIYDRAADAPRADAPAVDAPAAAEAPK